MKILITLGWISLLLCGCGEATHLVYVHEVSVGIDVAASAEGTGRFMFGYDRDTYTIVPRIASGQDAATLTTFGCIYANGLDEVQFNQFVSSGEAAKNIAKSPDTLKQINQAIHGGGSTCKQ
ncbi:hypothetical protein [Methylovulum miyakonense]|uniref:hypothetical protein n=1 Tax=Methylovulum miyakonense TaxID=645578 RepID=UPI000363A4BE|nr:hypothetical protein [Methylovulum miyakonense]